MVLRGVTSLELILVQDEKCDLVTDSHSILARQRSHFYQLFNVHGMSDVRHREIHTAEPLVPEASAHEVEMGIGKLRRHESLGVDQSQQN